jgi:hypothetical protein
VHCTDHFSGNSAVRQGPITSVSSSPDTEDNGEWQNGNQTNTQENPGTRRTRDLPAPAAYVRNAQSSKSVVVRFTSTPPDAELWVDGEYWGATPTADLTRLSAGPHTILVKKLGYQPWERKVTFAPGDDRTITAELLAEQNDGSKPRIVGND